MLVQEIIHKQTGEKLVMFEEGDFEYKNPIKHYRDTFIVKKMVLSGVHDDELSWVKKPSDISKQLFVHAAMQWQEMLKNFRAISVPQALIKLLDTTKKSEQEALLKGIVLTPDLLMAFLIAAEQNDYTLSQYTSEFSQKGLDTSKMPFAFKVNHDGGVKTFGETELSNAQLKQSLECRKKNVAKILDKGDVWHCFFVTYKSLNGGETWLGQKQPHYHYISNAFGIDRNDVINQIKSEKYKLGNLPHIKIRDYGKQPE